MEQVASPAFESEKESEKDSGQDREPRVAAAPWWAALDERAAALLAAKCHGTATVELRDEAAEPHSFDMGTFVFIFLENLLMPLSIMPRFCSGRGRRGLVEVVWQQRGGSDGIGRSGPPCRRSPLRRFFIGGGGGGSLHRVPHEERWQGPVP